MVPLSVSGSELLDIWLFEEPHSLLPKLFQTQNMWLPVDHLFPRVGTQIIGAQQRGMIRHRTYMVLSLLLSLCASVSLSEKWGDLVLPNNKTVLGSKGHIFLFLILCPWSIQLSIHTCPWLQTSTCHPLFSRLAYLVPWVQRLGGSCGEEESMPGLFVVFCNQL